MVDPTKLVSFPQVAEEYDRNAEYLRQLAIEGSDIK